MTTSDETVLLPDPTEAYVWVWLPGARDPVVAGRVEMVGQRTTFTYGRSYLERPDAISLFRPELPLQRGRIDPLGGLTIAGCLADAGPDSWGQRVIDDRYSSAAGQDLGPLVYLLESGSDRIGALDFQASPSEYVPRTQSTTAALEDLQSAADLLDRGEPLPAALDVALLRGTSIGGARPKAIVRDGASSHIAKFSSTTDRYPVVKAEGVAMDLARRVGLDVAPTTVVQSLDKDVLLVERFDRTPTGARRSMVSALTMLGLSEMNGRYATYPDLADLIRSSFRDPGPTLRELFSRIVFNVAVGNIDDHARNHAAFWDGEMLELTPAYDLCPQVRSGGEAAQAMAVGRAGERRSQFAVCVAAAHVYHLSTAEAQEIVDAQVETITREWADAADAARLTQAERQRLWGTQILNEFAFYERQP